MVHLFLPQPRSYILKYWLWPKIVCMTMCTINVGTMCCAKYYSVINLIFEIQNRLSYSRHMYEWTRKIEQTSLACGNICTYDSSYLYVYLMLGTKVPMRNVVFRTLGWYGTFLGSRFYFFGRSMACMLLLGNGHQLSSRKDGSFCMVFLTTQNASFFWIEKIAVCK